MSINDIGNSYALPENAQFNLKPSAIPSKRKRINIQPYQSPSGAITTSQLIQFYIPSRKGTMYDPSTLYIRGTVTCTVPTVGQARLNRNAFSLIDRLQVYGQDSTLLEDVQNYNDLCHALMDVQMNREDKRGLSSMYGGASEILTVTSTANDTVANAVAGLTTVNNADRGTNLATAATTLNFCIPVVSSLGVLSSKLIPVGMLASDLRFDFYTELPNVAFRSHTAAFGGAEAVTSYTLTNLEMVVDIIEFDTAGQQLLNEIVPPESPIYIASTSYKGYTSSIPNGTLGNYSVLIPHRSLSVKDVFAFGQVATTNGYDSFARFLPFGSSNLQTALNVGGSRSPDKPIVNTAEAFAELQKTLHSFNQVLYNGSINSTEYAKYRADCASVANALTCKSLLGFDCEIFSNKSDVIINGQNWTNGANVFLEGYVADDAAGSALGAAVTLKTFVGFDCIHVIQNGIISTRF